MTLFLLFFQFLPIFSAETDTLTLKDGRTLPFAGEFQLKKGVFFFRDQRRGYFCLPARLIDFHKTFGPRPRPEKTAKSTGRNREIPWDHPNYRDKTFSLRVIEINNEDLTTYSQSIRPNTLMPKPPDSTDEPPQDKALKREE